MKRSILVAAFTLSAAIAALAAYASEGIGTIVFTPGHWRVQQQIWIDGKEVLSTLDEAAKKINDGIRADLSPADRAAFDREVAQRGSLNIDSECITEAQSRMNARAALTQAMQSLHAPPWSCSFSDEQASSSGIAWRYSCRTSAGGKAEGSAEFKARNSKWYEQKIEGRSHVIDNKTGAPLEPRILPVSGLTTGTWVAEQCPAEIQEESSDSDEADGEEVDVEDSSPQP